MEGILSVKLSADITLHNIFILIIFQPTISLQPLRKVFPFFLFAIVVGSWSTASTRVPATLSLSGTILGSSSFVWSGYTPKLNVFCPGRGWKLTVLMRTDRKNLLKTELLETRDDLTIVTWFPCPRFSQTQTKMTGNRCVFKFLLSSVDEKH